MSSGWNGSAVRRLELQSRKSQFWTAAGVAGASLPAKRLNWTDRGVIRVGAFADLVLFNPATVIDRSTFQKPFELPSGIEKVFVNGLLVWDAGKATGARPGRVLPN